MRGIVRLTLLALGLAFVSPSARSDVIAVRWYGQVYDLSSTGGPARLLGESGVFGLNALARDPSGDLYAAGAFPTLYTINPTTGRATAVATITLPDATSVSINGLAFSPAGELYAINRNSGNTFFADLYRIDPATGVGTSVATIGRLITDISFASDGTLYGWDVGTQGNGVRNGLVRVDPTTGALTDVSTTVGGTTDVQALFFDRTGVTLFGGGMFLARYDRQTAARTVIPIPNIDGFPYPIDLRGMAFVPEPASALLVALGCSVLAMTRRPARR